MSLVEVRISEEEAERRWKLREQDIFSIYEGFMPEVEKKIAAVQKKCKKYGNDFTYEVVGEEIRKFYDNEDYKPVVIRNYRFVNIKVSGIAKINGWEVVATVEHYEEGNVIRRIVGYEGDIPERFKTIKPVCEHCNSSRFRKKLYIIHNVENDTFLQVGKSCLRNYNGINITNIIWYLDSIAELEEYTINNAVRMQPSYEVEHILGYTVEVLEKVGSYWNAESDIPTKYLVRNLVESEDLDKAIKFLNKRFEKQSYLKYDKRIIFSRDDFSKPDTASKVEAIINYYSSLSAADEFTHNIQTLLKHGYAECKHIGYLAYLPEGYRRYLENIEYNKKKEVEAVKSSWYGEVGKRYKDVAFTEMKQVTSWMTDYGITVLYKIVLESGEALIWKTSKCFDEDDGNSDTGKITFTVKNHNEYGSDSEKQTEVTRCKVIFN